jgi:hypothetical protein
MRTRSGRAKSSTQAGMSIVNISEMKIETYEGNMKLVAYLSYSDQGKRVLMCLLVHVSEVGRISY